MKRFVSWRGLSGCAIAVLAVLAVLVVTSSFPRPALAAPRARTSASAHASAATPARALDTTLTLDAVRQPDGVTVRVGGALTDETGEEVASATVRVDSSSDGAAWTMRGEYVTDATGAYSATFPLTRNTGFRAVYSGSDGAFLPAASIVATVTFLPAITWVKTLPTQIDAGTKYKLIVSASVPAHTSSAGSFRITDYSGGSGGVRMFTAAAAFNAATGLTQYSASVNVAVVGSWTYEFVLAADDTHEGAVSLGGTAWSGATALSISVSKGTVGVGKPVTLKGSLRSKATGHGLPGMSVRVESSRDRVNWTKVATTKSDSQGRVRYTVRPRSRHMYRFVFIGGSKWQGFTGTNKLVQTKFTLTGTKPGDFTSKSLWMSTGLRDMRITVAGAHQSVYIHNQTHSQSLLLVNTPGTFSGALQIISAGYGHFRVTGSGRFTIEVWN